jgi:antitoxin ParD1/3/4
MNVSLPDPMKAWVEDRLKDGRFGNTSDYVRHLIRRDRARQEAIAMLQGAIDTGVASGEPEPFDFAEFRGRKRARHGAS